MILRYGRLYDCVEKFIHVNFADKYYGNLPHFYQLHARKLKTNHNFHFYANQQMYDFLPQ